MVEQHLFPEKRKKREVGGQAPEPYREQKEIRKSWRKRHLLPEKQKNREVGRQSTGTLPGTKILKKRNQEMMVEQHLLPEKGKNREVGGQAPKP